MKEEMFTKHDQQRINEATYQGRYSSLREWLSEIPMTEHQRDRIQQELDDMEEIFRNANLNPK